MEALQALPSSGTLNEESSSDDDFEGGNNQVVKKDDIDIEDEQEFEHLVNENED